MPHNTPDKPLVIFDGVCGFCNRFVALALRHDIRGELLFASNRSGVGLELCQKLELIKESSQTIIVVVGSQVLLRSDAVIFIAEQLEKPYCYFSIIRILPRFLRDLGYRLIASIRRLIPLNHEACELLPEEMKRRIIS